MFIHIDIDCFFVSAHRIKDKNLKGIPVAVGGRSNLNIFSDKKEIRKISENSGAFVSTILTNEGEKTFNDYFVDKDGRIRGIITTCSYEARGYGVKTAMSVNEALRLCPHLKMVPPNYPLYHELSHKMLVILKNEIPLVEQFSIDEFFGDLRGYINKDEIVDFATKIKKRIKNELGLPVSIGIAHSKYLSKLMTEFAKPDGIKYVSKEHMKSFIKDIPIEEFPGIGKGYQKRLKGYGIKTLGDIERRKALFFSWKKPGIELYNRIVGENDTNIIEHRDKKSIGIGRTFDCIYDREELKRRVMILSRYLCFLVKKADVNPQTYHIKIKYDSNIKSKDYINVNRIFNETDFKKAMVELFKKNDIHTSHGVIQLNLTVSNFANKNSFVSDIFEYESDIKKRKLTQSLQTLREKYGVDIIKNFSELQTKDKNSH